MDSRRSSETSLDDQSRRSPSLEYEDYPLDLVSPVSISQEQCTRPCTFPIWRLPKVSPKRTFERDRFITDEIITDMGSRRFCEYRNKNAIHANGEIPVFISQAYAQEKENYLKANEEYSGLEEHYQKPSRCNACQHWCETICKPCLAKYHPLPDRPSWKQSCRHALLCPPHGRLSHNIGLTISAALVWAVLLAIAGPDALPGGNLFALTLLVVLGYIAGLIVAKIRLPPLLGMLVVGCLLRNIPIINIAKDIDPKWSSVLRSIALVVILLRAGLGLDPKALRKLSIAVLRLAFLPCLFETLAVGIASHLLLGFPWLWGFMLGFVLSAVTPAVVVPSMLSLSSKGYGVDQGIPTLVIAAASVDDVLAITGFTVLLAVVFSQGDLALTIMRGPLEALGGIIYGVFLGFVLWYIPHHKHNNVVLLRFLILLGGGLFAAFGSRAINCPGAGALGCLVLAFMAALKWRKQGWVDDNNPVEIAIGKLWLLFEPLLFGLIGAEIDFSKISTSTIGLGIAVIMIGSAARMVIAFLAVLKTGLTWREMFFIPFAWLPKGTVQAAIGSVAFDTARDKNASEDKIEIGLQMVAIAVLVILIMAPLGAALIALTGPRLLSKSKEKRVDEEGEKFDLAWDDQMDFNVDLAKMDVCLTGQGQIEVTTERETVT